MIAETYPKMAKKAKIKVQKPQSISKNILLHIDCKNSPRNDQKSENKGPKTSIYLKKYIIAH
jgi:hypothetical protein